MLSLSRWSTVWWGTVRWDTVRRSVPSCLVVSSLLVICPSLTSAANRDVCSTCTYTTLSAAATAASSGDTIRMAEGTYAELIQLPNGKDLTIHGGYNSTFTVRDPATHETIIDQIGMGGFHSGEIVIDGITVTGAQGQGIFTQNVNTDITITNCKIHNNTYAGILLNQVGTAVVSGNTVYANGAYGGIQIGTHTQVTVSDNTTYDHTCSYCGGIYVSNALTGDVIERNTSYNNYFGLNIQANSATQAPQVYSNNFYDNSTNGIYSISGNTDFRHNIVRGSGYTGVYHIGATSIAFRNNIIAENGARGIQIVGAAVAAPIFKNNIFYLNSGTAIAIAGNDAGWGSSNVIPAEFKYNCFFNPYSSLFVHGSLAPAYAYNEEMPDAWGDLNGFAWAEGNLKTDPGFVDATTHDYRLKSSSFLIDEGDPADDYSYEPGSNGSRINIGVYGNTSAAEGSAAAPTISNVTAVQSGSDLVLGFDTNTATDYLWLTAELWNGSSYSTISQTKLSGTGYVVGYKTGRNSSGSARSVTYTDAATDFAGQQLANAKVRLTVEHGGVSANAESGAFSIDYLSPTVSITSPTAGGEYYTRTPSITANASDSSGIANVIFRYKLSSDSSYTVLNTDSTAPFAANWGSSSLTSGESYDLLATATDMKGNVSDSTSVSITIVPCEYSLTSSSADVSAAAGSATVSLTASSGDCSWNAASDGTWVTLSSLSGNGGHLFDLQYTENSGASRTTTVTLAGQIFTLRQAAAEILPTQRTLTVTKPLKILGSVISSPSGISCDESCTSQSAQISDGAQVTLTADPSEGYRFLGWGGSCSGTRSCAVTLTSDATVEARFVEDSKFQLSIELLGEGSGAVSLSPRGTSCGEGCYLFAKRKGKPVAVTITAKPKSGSRFRSWGGSCRGADRCILSLAKDRRVIAKFDRKRKQSKDR